MVLVGMAAMIATAGVLTAVPADAATNSIISTTKCGEAQVASKNFSSAAKSATVKPRSAGMTAVNHKFASTYSSVFFTDSATKHVSRST